MPSRGAEARRVVATIQRYEGDKVVLLFDSVGYKSLLLESAETLLTRR